MNLRTINHLVATVWILYGLHFGSTFATIIGLLWTTVFIVEVIYAMIYFDSQTDSIIRSSKRFQRDRAPRWSDMTGSDYESYNKR